MNKKTIFVFLMSALLVTGCGGGSSSVSSNSGSGGSGGTTSSSSITTNTAPTAKFSTSSLSSATSLATEVQKGTPALVAAAAVQNMPGAISTLPGGIGSLPAGASTQSCNGGGSETVDTNVTGAISAGSYYSLTFSSCVVMVNAMTITLNGSGKLTYTAYTDANNYALSVSFTNFSSTIVDSTQSLNVSYGPETGSFTMQDIGGSFSYQIQLPNGGATDLSAGSVTQIGNTVTISSATYVYNSSSAGGIIKVVYNNWTYDASTGYPAGSGSGTITISDAKGNTVVIQETGSSTVTVTYTINGAAVSYSVTYP